MTIGALSRRTGVPVKTLREYEDLGLIYTMGRSAGNYRLFEDEAHAVVRGGRQHAAWFGADAVGDRRTHHVLPRADG